MASAYGMLSKAEAEALHSVVANLMMIVNKQESIDDSSSVPVLSV